MVLKCFNDAHNKQLILLHLVDTLHRNKSLSKR